MEIENKRTDLALWLCISILFHLLLTMLGVITIKTLEKKEKKKLDLDPIINKKNLTEQPETAKISNRVAHSVMFMNPTKTTKEKKSMNKDDEHPSKNKKSSIKPLANILNSSISVPSKKHRPAEKFTEEHKSCELPETPKSKKKKFSLSDLKKGFSRFVQQGNDSINLLSNSELDNEAGIKKLSYIRQALSLIDRVFNNDSSNRPCNEFLKKYVGIALTIERSGKISKYQAIQSCGDQFIDAYFSNKIKSIKNMPPVPKYLEAPLNLSIFGDFRMPTKPLIDIKHIQNRKDQ